jgi:rubredoxin
MKNDPFRFVQPNQQRANQPQADFQDLEATELYCPKCGRAVPVRKFLLLILPDGDRYEYRCQFCGTKVGEKTDRSGQYYGVLRG